MSVVATLPEFFASVTQRVVRNHLESLAPSIWFAELFFQSYPVTSSGRKEQKEGVEWPGLDTS